MRTEDTISWGTYEHCATTAQLFRIFRYALPVKIKISFIVSKSGNITYHILLLAHSLLMNMAKMIDIT